MALRKQFYTRPASERNYPLAEGEGVVLDSRDKWILFFLSIRIFPLVARRLQEGLKFGFTLQVPKERVLRNEGIICETQLVGSA